MRHAATAIALLAALLTVETARAEPSWINRKKKIVEQKEAEEAYKESEKPVISTENAEAASQASTLSQDTRPPPRTNLLFRQEGLTETLMLDYGNLKQDALGGGAISALYGYGWWWTPKLVVGFSGRATARFEETYVLLMASVGAHARFFLTKRWIVGGFAGYGMSQGLSRVEQAHVPPPPGPKDLGARRGPVASVNLGHLFWIRRDFAIGPFASFWFGKQDERSFTMLTFGLTYQSGKPNYTGDITE